MKINAIAILSKNNSNPANITLVHDALDLAWEQRLKDYRNPEIEARMAASIMESVPETWPESDVEVLKRHGIFFFPVNHVRVHNSYGAKDNDYITVELPQDIMVPENSYNTSFQHMREKSYSHYTLAYRHGVEADKDALHAGEEFNEYLQGWATLKEQEMRETTLVLDLSYERPNAIALFGGTQPSWQAVLEQLPTLKNHLQTEAAREEIGVTA